MIVVLLTAVLAIAGCGPLGQGSELRSSETRATPTATAAEVEQLVRGNNEFAFGLYDILATSGGNLFYSPYSISVALAMTYAGASGETERQMTEALRFLLPKEMLHRAFNSLDAVIASRGSESSGEPGQQFQLNIANAVWGQLDHEFREKFLDELARHYGAGVRPVDFVANPEGSRTTINDWVAERTEDRIRDLLPPDIITTLTRMVLTNAIYFNAAWEYPFEPGRTSSGDFHLLNGGVREVPMMRALEAFGYATGDGYQALELPYVGGELAMTLLLPDAGRFQEFEARLDAALAEKVLADIVVRNVNLEMPRFEFETQFLLSNAFKALGMPNAFDPSAAEFAGIDGKSCLAGDEFCLYIREVVHKAFVAVDEEGTEAAAATAVVVQIESAPPNPVWVTVDRPFLFLVRDRGTGAILFIGKVEDP